MEYESLAEETLESLATYFDEILEKSTLEDVDVAFGVSFQVCNSLISERM